MATVRVQTAPFDVGAEIAAMLSGRTDVGGIASFIGIVRDSAAGQPVTAMTLEHYPGMTERALSAIVAEAEARWTLQACTVIHRHGRLRPGDPIVLVLTASPHRQAALDATAFLMDWLKTKAPFWKSEEREGAGAQWVAARDADDAAAARWGTGTKAAAEH
ncbi:MAG: molybdenum cofactor biosynthesis protein MoaE [Gemmatimonadaceae bacterium]|nr:molybdenum cofactor biosynthesis protein MoaE [Acetobacteraceae bacterium]